MILGPYEINQFLAAGQREKFRHNLSSRTLNLYQETMLIRYLNTAWFDDA